jgi:hypothetical protein
MSTADWDQRRLCPDGGCVGVLGDDGVCNGCGKPGGPAISAASEEEDEREYEDDGEDADGDDDEDGEDADGDEEEDGDDEPDDAEPGTARVGWSDRSLCPDGGCIGVIGDNGKCKVCGRSAA